MRPGREHDTTALRIHAEALPLLAEWTDEDHAVLADLGYEGERAALTTPIKHRTGRRLTDDQRTVNLLHADTRAPAERGNALLKTTVKALRRISLCPWRIGAITAAALVLLHHAHDHHMINEPATPLLGMAHCARATSVLPACSSSRSVLPHGLCACPRAVPCRGLGVCRATPWLLLRQR